MKKDDRISIFLSPGELYCIAGSLGFQTLPLLNSFFQNIPVDQLKTMLLDGLESLKNRSLIWEEGGKTVTDQTLKNLVEVIGRPQYALAIFNMTKSEPPSQSFIYFKAGQSLAVTQKGRYFDLSLFRDRVSLKRTLDSWIGISSQVSDKAKSIIIPSLDTAIKLMSAVWKDPYKATEKLEASGVDEKEVDDLMKVVQPCTFFSRLTRINWENNVSAQISRLLVLGNSSSLWAQEIIQNNPVVSEFTPFHCSDLSVMLRKYIHVDFNEPTSGTDAAENQEI